MMRIHVDKCFGSLARHLLDIDDSNAPARKLRPGPRVHAASGRQLVATLAKERRAAI